MSRWRSFVATASLASALLFSASVGLVADDKKPEPGKQEPQKLERVIKVTMDYLLYLPKDYGQKDSRKWSPATRMPGVI